MAGVNHHHPYKSSDRKSRWESNSSATSAPNNPEPNPSNSKPSPNPNKQIKPGNSNFNKKPTPQPSQPNTGPNPSKQNHQSSTHQQPDPFSYPDLSQLGPTPQPTYGFHMLLRRTITLADGTVRSYFALPPDYEEFSSRKRSLFDVPGQLRGGGMSPKSKRHVRDSGRESQDYWNSLGLDNMHSGPSR